MPSTSPLTSIPSSAPSFVGLIVSVDISRPATAALDDSEINELQDVIASAYGVEADDLTTTTEYVTTGAISVTIPDSVSTQEALECGAVARTGNFLTFHFHEKSKETLWIGAHWIPIFPNANAR